MSEYDYLFKIIIVGDAGVGKSSLLMRYVDGVYNNVYSGTIGVDYRVCTIKGAGPKDDTIKLQLWDTAGQERFRHITTAYFRGAQLAIIVFDLCDIDSFRSVKYWLDTAEREAPADAIRILVGSKADGRQRVSALDIDSLVQEYNITYMTCSALTGAGIEELFNAATRLLKERYADTRLVREKGLQITDVLKTKPCSMCLHKA